MPNFSCMSLGFLCESRSMLYLEQVRLHQMNDTWLQKKEACLSTLLHSQVWIRENVDIDYQPPTIHKEVTIGILLKNWCSETVWRRHFSITFISGIVGGIFRWRKQFPQNLGTEKVHTKWCISCGAFPVLKQRPLSFYYALFAAFVQSIICMLFSYLTRLWCENIFAPKIYPLM